MEALRLLAREKPDPMLLVTATDGALTGIVTKTDILRAVESSHGSQTSDSDR
jgi:predicted transcriptional regulator